MTRHYYPIIKMFIYSLGVEIVCIILHVLILEIMFHNCYVLSNNWLTRHYYPINKMFIYSLGLENVCIVLDVLIIEIMFHNCYILMFINK